MLLLCCCYSVCGMFLLCFLCPKQRVQCDSIFDSGPPSVPAQKHPQVVSWCLDSRVTKDPDFLFPFSPGEPSWLLHVRCCSGVPVPCIASAPTRGTFFSSSDIFDAMFPVTHIAGETVIQQGVFPASLS